MSTRALFACALTASTVVNYWMLARFTTLSVSPGTLIYDVLGSAAPFLVVFIGAIVPTLLVVQLVPRFRSAPRTKVLWGVTIFTLVVMVFLTYGGWYNYTHPA